MATSVTGAVNAFIQMMDPNQGGALPQDSMVWFGKALSRDIPPTTLQITAVMIHEDEPGELGPLYRHEEVFSIECELTVYYGDNDNIQRLDDVMALYDIVSSTVSNNPTLNGNVRVAIPKKTEYVPGTDAKGFALGTLSFTIDCEQRVASLT